MMNRFVIVIYAAVRLIKNGRHGFLQCSLLVPAQLFLGMEARAKKEVGVIKWKTNKGEWSPDELTKVYTPSEIEEVRGHLQFDQET